MAIGNGLKNTVESGIKGLLQQEFVSYSGFFSSHTSIKLILSLVLFSIAGLLEKTVAESPVSRKRLNELAQIFVEATELEIAFWDAAMAKAGGEA